MILWGAEHEYRARNLANAFGDNHARLAPLVAQPGDIPVSGDRTLTIWGHGGPDSFAELTAAQLGDFIKAWKRKNPALTTLELVTCDARHSTDIDNRDSFTDKLMQQLVNASKVLVKVKSLPRGGSTATTSELFASESLGWDGYYFIAADNASSLDTAKNIFSTAWSNLPVSTPDAQKYPAMFKIAKEAMDKAALKGPVGYVTSVGSLTKLRDILVDVTVYIQNGQRLAVPKVLAS